MRPSSITLLALAGLTWFEASGEDIDLSSEGLATVEDACVGEEDGECALSLRQLRGKRALELSPEARGATAASKPKLMKGVSYGPVPLKSSRGGSTLHEDDWMAPAAKPMWGPAGRWDLGVIAALGANFVRLYGNDPNNDHSEFLDEALRNGLQVAPGMSDYPYYQMKGSCRTTGYDCYSQVKELYSQNLKSGFLTKDKTYHPALAYFSIINEPDLKMPPTATGGGYAGVAAMCKAIVSAFDAVLDAEKENGVQGAGINFTATFSFAVCSSCSWFKRNPALGQMTQLEDAMLNPMKYGYMPRNDIPKAFKTRWTNSFNTQNKASDLPHMLLSDYDKTFKDTPVYIAARRPSRSFGKASSPTHPALSRSPCRSRLVRTGQRPPAGTPLRSRSPCRSRLMRTGASASSRDPLASQVDECSAKASRDKGLSIHYLATEFAALVEKAGFARDACVYDIEEKVIRGHSASYTCPRDGRLGCALVDTVSGEDLAGPATHMLSYTWGYAVGDIVDSLQQWCEEAQLDPKRTYVWICCLCVNQHRVNEKQAAGEAVPFSEFKQVFESRVTTIGRMIALMMPWDAPAYIGRSWCMLEMYTALQLEGACELTIRMPQRESESWAAEIISGGGAIQKVNDALREASILKSRCAVPADEEQILRLVKGGNGINEFDQRVKKHLQEWFLRTASKHVRLFPAKLLKTCASVGKLLNHFGRHEDARLILDFGIDHRRCAQHLSPSDSSTSVPHEVLACLWQESAWLLRASGRPGEASRQYTTGLQELEARGASSTEAASSLLRGRARCLIGDEADELFIQGAKPSECDVDLALEDYRRSVHILNALGQGESQDAAGTCTGLGLALSLRSEFEEALATFEEAGRILAVLDCLRAPENALRLRSLGGMHLKHGRVVAAKGGDPTPMWTAAASALHEAISILEMFPEEASLRPACVAKLAWLRRRAGLADAALLEGL